MAPLIDTRISSDNYVLKNDEFRLPVYDARKRSQGQTYAAGLFLHYLLTLYSQNKLYSFIISHNQY